MEHQQLAGLSPVALLKLLANIVSILQQRLTTSRASVLEESAGLEPGPFSEPQDFQEFRLSCDSFNLHVTPREPDFSCQQHPPRS